MASGFLLSRGLNVNKPSPSHSPLNCYWKLVFNGHKQIWWVSVEETMICILIKINDYKYTVLVCWSNTRIKCEDKCMQKANEALKEGDFFVMSD